jgi:putative ABC transport system ATP-binding protein
MSEDQNTIVSIRDISKVYGSADNAVYALKEISLDIFAQEFLAIMGPSGSGKSTLFNMIGALDKPSAGEVLLGGRSLPELSSKELAYLRCRHIGYVFQSYNLIPSLTALENVALPLTFLGKSKDEKMARAEEVLTFVGLKDRMDHIPGRLSGGQQQRVAIARALANNPTILLADEPTANLDKKTGAECIDIFKNLITEFGTTVISATHDHKMLKECSRIVWVDSGQVAKIQKVSDMDIKLGSLSGED